MKERIAALKDRREVVEASLARIAEQAQSRAAVTPDKIQTFTALMHQKLYAADNKHRKAYLAAIISRIEVDDEEVRVIGRKADLLTAVTRPEAAAGQVRGFVRKWRAQQESNLRPQD